MRVFVATVVMATTLAASVPAVTTAAQANNFQGTVVKPIPQGTVVNPNGTFYGTVVQPPPAVHGTVVNPNPPPRWLPVPDREFRHEKPR